MENTDTQSQKIYSFFNKFFNEHSQNCEQVQILMEKLVKDGNQSFQDNEVFKKFISQYLQADSIINFDQKINELYLEYQKAFILDCSQQHNQKLDENQQQSNKHQSKENDINIKIQSQVEINDTETNNDIEKINSQHNRNQDIDKSIYKIKESFQLVNNQVNLVSNLQKKAKIVLSESEIFEKSLEAILNLDPSNIYGIRKLGQKLKDQYIQVFKDSDLIGLIKEYLSNPQNLQLDQAKIKSEFIKFSNENKFTELIQEDTSYESDPAKIYEEQFQLILRNQFSNLEQVENLCESNKEEITQKYNESNLKEMICIYDKAQNLLNQKRPNQGEQEESKNEDSMIKENAFNQDKQEQSKINNQSEQVDQNSRNNNLIQEQNQSGQTSQNQQNQNANDINEMRKNEFCKTSIKQNISEPEMQAFMDRNKIYSNQNERILKIKEILKQNNSELSDNQIFEMINEMKELGYESPIYLQHIQNQDQINKSIFNFHLEFPFLNLKTYKVCQFYFERIDIKLTEYQSKQLTDQYFYKIPSLEMKQEELEKFKQIEEGISQYPFIKDYIQQICPLSIQVKIQQLFNLQQVDESVLRQLINSENSQEQLKAIVEKYNLSKDHENFFIVDQIFENLSLKSLYLKSLLQLELNKQRDDEKMYFYQTYIFLKDLQEHGLDVLNNEKYQQIMELLKINENIINSKKLKNLDNYFAELLLITCTSDDKKIKLIKFILNKQLKNLNENEIVYLSKQILRTGLKFLYQSIFEKPKQIEKKLLKVKLLEKIYGKDLYEVDNINFYCDFEYQFQIQNKRDKIFRLKQFIDINYLQEYQNSQLTSIQDWTKQIADSYIKNNETFSQQLFDLIIYLSKRNQNIDSAYQGIQKWLIHCVQEQERLLINKRALIEYLMCYSDSQSKFKLTLMLGFANPIPLLNTRIVKLPQQNSYQLQPKFCFESFWLLREQDKVVASIGIGFQKGKSQFLNEVFATNFAISDNSYSFIQSADIQSNHIFLQNKRQYFIADFHGDASQLEEQFILGFFVYFIIHVNISIFKKNKTDDLKRIINLLNQKKKKYCIIIRDFDEKNLSQNNQYKNQNLAYEMLKDPLLEKQDAILFPNYSMISREKQQYYLTVVRIQLDNLIRQKSVQKNSREIFLKKLSKNKIQLPQPPNCQSLQKKELDIQNELIKPFKQVSELCEYIKSEKNFFPEQQFKYYTVFSNYQKHQMELNERNFKNSDSHQLILRYNKSQTMELKYRSLINSAQQIQKSEAIKQFEDIIFNQNFYINMLLLINELKEVNNFKICKLKAQKLEFSQQIKQQLISANEKDQIQKKIKDLDQQIQDNSISVELFWREIIQQWEIKKNNSNSHKIIEVYADSIYKGFPFEIIDGETFYYPFDFLQKCFSQPQFTDKKFCIISIIGPQNSGKSTLLNYFLGCNFYVSDGRCTRGIYGTLVKSKVPEFDYILVIDSEGLLSLEKDDPDYDRKLTLFCLSISQFLIINVKDQLTVEMNKILEICVEVSSELKANQIPKRVIEIVFNQKSDPNYDNNKVAINKALENIQKNPKISDHIEISIENASGLPIAFSQKYLELTDQSQNWSYLETQMTFVEAIQKLGNKIINNLKRNSYENDQKTIKVAKSIPDLLQLMKHIYEVIKENTDLTAFRDVLHKNGDQEVKHFIKQQINEQLNNQFQQKINQMIQNQNQDQNGVQNNQIDGEFEYLENLIKLTTESEFKQKISGEILSTNLKYLKTQIEIQKNDFLSRIHFNNQMKVLNKSISSQKDEILREIHYYSYQIFYEPKESESKLQDLNNRLFENFNINIKKSFFSEDYRSVQSDQEVSFQKLQGHLEMKLNFSEQKLKYELEKIKLKLKQKKYEKKLQFLNQQIQWFHTKKENLAQVIEKQEVQFADFYRDFFIQQVKSQLQKNPLELINFELFFKSLNEEIIASINIEKRSKIDKELISKIANLVLEQIKKVNQTLSIFSEQLSQRAENSLHNMAIQQLCKQDEQNKKNIIKKPIEEYQNERKIYQRYFQQFASNLEQETELAIRYKITIQQVCLKVFKKKSDDIIENILLNYKDQLSKQSIIKELQIEFIRNPDERQLKQYINDANSVIIQQANQNSKTYIQNTHEKIKKIKQKIQKSVKSIFEKINTIFENFKCDDPKIIDKITVDNMQNEYKILNEKQKVRGFQEFVFQILLDEHEDIVIDNNKLNIDLQRPIDLNLEEYDDKELFKQFFLNKPSFTTLYSLRQFYQLLEERIKFENLSNYIQEFSTRNIEKEFSSINDNLSNCKAKCPSCGQVCDQDHWKYPHIKIGEEQNKHTVDSGHRFAAFNGVKVQKERIPALIMCSDYEENTQIICQQKMNGNGILRKKMNQQEGCGKNIWQIVGQDICQKYDIQYQDICDIRVLNKCKQQVNPIHFIFAFDESGSMNGQKWQSVRDQLVNFIKKRFDCSAQDFCTLVGFNQYAYKYLQVQNLNLEIIEKIPKKNKDGGTCFSSVFQELIKILNLEQSKAYKKNTILFFLSDGEASKPDQEIQNFKNQCHNLIKQIYFIGFGNSDFKILEQMADDLMSLNAQFSKVIDVEQLTKQFESLVLVFPNQSI
ncbi:hypothetical protein ABPG73_019948 [Tetrahymena malaccensis]